VATEVFTVEAVNPNLTMTDINVTANEYLWFSFRSDGQWSTCKNGLTLGSPLTSADGYAGSSVAPPHAVNANGVSLPSAMLVGNLSSSTAYFPIGQQLTMPAPGTGRLGVLCNDDLPDYVDNIGVQIVRVVVTVKN
jgi:hypothetical protein